VHGVRGGGGDNGKEKERKMGCWASLQGDVGSMCLLLLLYTLQGVPMGLSGSIPFLLTDRYGVDAPEPCLTSVFFCS
jgi:PAT family acetyl-CoA transporter-like MFS transporter 1